MGGGLGDCEICARGKILIEIAMRGDRSMNR